MKFKSIAVALAFLAMMLATARPVAAETAAEVQNRCKFFDQVQVGADRKLTIPNNFAAGFCWGAFAALQTAGRIVVSKAERPLHFCPPTGAGRVDFIKIFLRYAARHPEFAQDEFAVVALDALIEAFPCDVKQREG